MYSQSIYPMQRDSLLTPEEGDLARKAQLAGNHSHTIGFELEVLESAARQLLPTPLNVMQARLRCEDTIERYHFGVFSEGVYEIASPYAKHPTPLRIATHGLVRAGVLPAESAGMVNAHVSVGSYLDAADMSTLPRFATLLRVVEQLDGTTANRLMLPVKKAREQGASDISELEATWACKGTAGVKISHKLDDYQQPNWQAMTDRIELRTLGYYSPQQFGQTMDIIYTLSRGLTADPGTPERKRYDWFEAEVESYFDDHALPHSDRLMGRGVGTVKHLADYMQPFADHHRHTSKAILGQMAWSAVHDLREEFGLSGLEPGSLALSA